MRPEAPSDPAFDPARRALEALSTMREESLRSLFRHDRPLIVTRAPARLDVMGGIADYSGSLVLEWPLACATFALLQPSDDGWLRVGSMSEDGTAARCFEERWERFGPLDDGFLLRARSRFRERSSDTWAAYALGPLFVLAKARGVDLSRGLRLLITSDVPEGKGVSSSAAIEVAVMAGAMALYDVSDLSPVDAALLCQTAENHVVGAPCGAMDPIAVGCGREDRLLALRCQPAELLGTLPIPAEWAVFGIDSGVRHAVTGADYREVRTAAFMGYCLLAEKAGLRYAPAMPIRERDLRWKGYLANVTPSELATEFAGVLPETMRGADFLARFGGIPDAVTEVEPGRTYRVRAATEHPIEEHHRVRTFMALLGGPPTEAAGAILGELMFQSHASYSRVGLGSEATDQLVRRVRAQGHGAGLFGAKITGGGSGGTVAILARRDAEPVVRAIAAQHGETMGTPPVVFTGSSEGAFARPARTMWMDGGAR